jgi:hypothetical protein
MKFSGGSVAYTFDFAIDSEYNEEIDEMRLVELHNRHHVVRLVRDSYLW